MSHVPAGQTAAPTTRLATCQGQPGLWDGQQFWPAAALQSVFTELSATIEQAETAACTDPATRATLPGLWWRWGWLARQLSRLGDPPTAAVPHRIEIVAPAQGIDSLHCWTCDAHIERPLTHTAAGTAAWYAALRAFADQHSLGEWEAD